MGCSYIQRSPSPRKHLNPSQEFQMSDSESKWLNFSLLEKYKVTFGAGMPDTLYYVNGLLFQSLVPLSTIRTNRHLEFEPVKTATNDYGVYPPFTHSRQFCCLQLGVTANPWRDALGLAGSSSLVLPSCFLLPLRPCLCSLQHQPRH